MIRAKTNQVPYHQTKMKKCLFVLLLFCVACSAQKKENKRIIGEWKAYRSVRLDKQPWMPANDGTMVHLKFFDNNKGEDWTFFPNVDKFDYELRGNDLYLGDVKYRVDSLDGEKFILLQYKGMLDIVNKNPYSSKTYLKRIEQ